MTLRHGFLSYQHGRSCDGNAGGGMFYRALAAHRQLELVEPDQIHSCDAVYVSVPSTGQVLDILSLARRHRWDRRGRTRIIVGGAGMQNPAPLAGFIDFAAFGRFRTAAGEIAETMESGDITDSLRGHVLAYEAPRRVSYRQEPLGETEEFTGCPLKCKFCHYTFARRYDSRSETRQYLQTSLGDSTPELMLEDVPTLTSAPARVRFAIDGSSWRLRAAYGKRIRGEQISDAISHLSRLVEQKYAAQPDLFDGRRNGALVAMVYNIVNFPGETDADIDELYADLRRARYRAGGNLVVVLQHTPFRASPTSRSRATAGWSPTRWAKASAASSPHWSNATVSAARRWTGCAGAHGRMRTPNGRTGALADSRSGAGAMRAGRLIGWQRSRRSGAALHRRGISRRLISSSALRRRACRRGRIAGDMASRAHRWCLRYRSAGGSSRIRNSARSIASTLGGMCVGW